MEIVWFIVGVAVALLGVLVVGFVWSARGILTLDTGWHVRRTRSGRSRCSSMHARGRLRADLGVYLGRTPAEFRGKLEVLERGTDMVLAAHRTRAARITSVDGSPHGSGPRPED